MQNIFRIHLSFPNKSSEEQNVILDKISDFLDTNITTEWCAYTEVNEYSSDDEIFKNSMRNLDP